MSAIEKFTTLSATSRNTTQNLARLALEGQEKMIRLNIDNTKEFIQTSGEQLRKSFSEMNQIHSVEAWPKVIMNNIQRGTDFNLNLLELTKRMQTELACVVEENLRTLRNGAMEAVGDYAKIIKESSKSGK